MPVDWLITTPQYPSGVSPATLGISLGVRTLRNRAASDLTFTVALPNVLADPPVAYGDWVTVIRNGVTWFAGQVSSTPKVQMSGGKITLGVVVSDPWFWWSKITYLQQWPSGPSTRTMLGGSPDGSGVMQYTDAAAITTATQITSLLDYAQTAAALSPSQGFFSPTAPALQSIPMFCEPLTSAPVSQALESCLRYHPNALTWFDYTHTSSGNPAPALYISDYGVNAGWDAITIPFSALKQPFTIESRPDLVLTGVVFFYEQQTPNEDGDTWLGYGVSETVQTDAYGITGALVNPASTLVATFAVGNGVTWGLLDVGTDFYSTAPLPIGLAQAVYNNHQHLHYDGELTLMPAEPGQYHRLMGRPLNISGGRPEWATMDALIQTVREDMVTGLTTIMFGSPRHVMPMSFKSLNNQYSQRGLSGGKPTAQSFRDTSTTPPYGTTETVSGGGLTLNFRRGLFTNT